MSTQDTLEPWVEAAREILDMHQRPWPTKTVRDIVRQACTTHAIQTLKELADTKTSLEVACAERDSLRAELDRKSVCPYIVNGEDGTQHCRLAESDAQQLATCRAALESAQRVAKVRVGMGDAFWGPVLLQINAALESAGPPPKT